jgi:hypothetical protein
MEIQIVTAAMAVKMMETMIKITIKKKMKMPNSN